VAGRLVSPIFLPLTVPTNPANIRYVDPPGPTVLAYTPDGRRVITGGSNQAIRIYTVGEDGEPKTVDGAIDGHCAIGATVCGMRLECDNWN